MIMFEEDIVLCSETTRVVEIQLVRWCTTLEIRRRKICWSKTEYLPLNGDYNDRIELGGVEIRKLETPSTWDKYYKKMEIVIKQ